MIIALPDNLLSLNTFYYMVVIFLSLLLGVLFVFLIGLIRKVTLRKKSSGLDLSNTAYNDALKILDNARSKSLELLQDSQLQAQEIINSAKHLDGETRKDFEKKIELINQDLIERYRATLEEEKNENIKSLNKTTEAVKQEMISEIHNFKNTLRHETIETQHEIDAKIKSSYEEIDKEIQQYKDEKIKSLNENISAILSDVISDLIGKNLETTEYEKLVIDMLEEEMAKRGFKKSTA